MNDWLSNLKAGDEVILHGGYNSKEIKTVDRITANYIIVGGTKFKKSNGFRAGSNAWHTCMIAEPNDEIRKEMRRNFLLYFLKTIICWNKVPMEKLESIYELLKEYKTEGL